MNEQSQSIDISPGAVAPIAQAGLKLLNLESTLVPGNMRGQLGVLEVFLAGLAGGQLVLAEAPKDKVESDAKKEPDLPPPGNDDDGPGSKTTDIRRGSRKGPRKTKA